LPQQDTSQSYPSASASLFRVAMCRVTSHSIRCNNSNYHLVACHIRTVLRTKYSYPVRNNTSASCLAHSRAKNTKSTAIAVKVFTKTSGNFNRRGEPAFAFRLPPSVPTCLSISLWHAHAQIRVCMQSCGTCSSPRLLHLTSALLYLLSALGSVAEH
jgi:hypothetical protein